MSRTAREDIVRAATATAERILAGRTDGLVLDRVEYVREGGRWFLRVFLDHPDGVTLGHCQEVSQAMSLALDREDPIPHSYCLEVSSPGAERPLRKEADFEKFKGRRATLRLYQPLQGRKELTGRLAGLGPGGEVVLDVEAGGEIAVPRDWIAKAHLALEWPAGWPAGEARAEAVKSDEPTRARPRP